MKKILAISLALLVAICPMFAGGSSESSSSSTPSLRMSWWGGDARHQATLSALSAFDGASVEGEYSGWDGYYQKIVTQIAGRTSADLIQIDQPWLAELCSRGDVFAEVDPSIVDLSQFDQTFLDGYCTYNGKLVGLPTGINVNTMLVDVALLEKSGIDPDTVWTWENIVTEGRKVHDTDPTCYFNAAAPDHMRFWFEVYMAQLAGGVVDSDKNVMFTYEQGVQAFQYFKQWFDYGIVAPFSETSIFYQKCNENPVWINGKMATMWSWVSSMERDIGSRQNIETRQLPVMDGAIDTGCLMRPSQIYVVSASSKNVSAAMELLDYMLNDDDAVKTLNTQRGIPASAKARAILTEEGAITEMSENATNEGIEQAGRPQSSWQMNSEVMQTMQDVIDEFGYGRLTPEEASQKMIDSLNSTLARLR